METQNDISSSPIYCNHANEMPYDCPCSDECYCKSHSCKSKRSITSSPLNQAVPNLSEDLVEVYEEAICDMRRWLSCIYSPIKADRALKIEYRTVPDSVVQKLYMRVKIWTATNVYSITVSIHVLHPPGYLGCGAQSRKSRTGENWTRGNDLADGVFGEETWQKILRDIVRYEAEEVKSEKWKETQVV